MNEHERVAVRESGPLARLPQARLRARGARAEVHQSADGTTFWHSSHLVYSTVRSTVPMVSYYFTYRADNRHARAALAAELLLLGDARHPHMGHRAGDAAGAPLTARSQDTSRPWPVHVHTLLMSTEPSHEPGALRHAPRGPSNWPRLLSLPRPGSRLPNRTSRLAG